MGPDRPGARRTGRVNSWDGEELRGGDFEGSFGLKQRPRPSLNHTFTGGGHLLKVEVTLNFLHEPGMKEVSRAVSDDGPEDRFAQQI